MPIPIKPNGDKNSLIDYTWLFSKIPSIAEPEKKIVTASDKDASLLMELWVNAERKDNEIFKIGKDVKLSSADIIRLKSHGLLTGGSDEVKLTNRGRVVITTMVLGENNNFLKNQKHKSYSEILASNDKRGKKGYRIPKFAANTNLIRLPKNEEK